MASSLVARLAVNPGGMCWTTNTAESSDGDSLGITSANARGPPVEAAMATA